MKETFGVLLVYIASLIFLGFLLAYPLMLLWNGCLVDAVSVVKPVGWLQMWGINILLAFMFKTSIKTKNEKNN